MHVAVFTIFSASRKEPLVEVVERIHAAFMAAGIGEPSIRFTLSDPPGSAETNILAALAGTKRVSSIERVLRRWPQWERYARTVGAAGPGRAAIRVMANLTEQGTVEPVDFAILCEIARGVPRSFPFHKITLHFSAPGFSDGPQFPAAPDRQTLSMLMRAGVDIGAGHPTVPGVSVQDSWWVNGRQRSVAALRVIEADPAAKKLPAPSGPVASVLAACGKARKTVQVPVAIGSAEPGQPAQVSPAAPPQPDRTAQTGAAAAGEAIRAVVQAYRTRIGELLETLPHDLPHQEEGAPRPLGTTSGPKKPELVRAFAPLGYDCRGESGTFTLRRRTGGQLTVKLQIDVGTWNDAVMAFLQVQGLSGGQGFKATLSLPVSRRAARGLVHGVELPGQFPIGSPERWRQIVDNLAALVAALDGSFVPEVEAAAGPSPDWYRPDTG